MIRRRCINFPLVTQWCRIRKSDLESAENACKANDTAHKMNDLVLPVYPLNAEKEVWSCWKALDAGYSVHIEKTGIHALLHLCRHLQPSIDNFWTFFARTLSSLSRNFPKWSKCSRFPFREDKINEWFDHELPSEGDEDNKVIKIMNVDRPGRRNKIYMKPDQPENFPMSLSNDNFEFFVHGTNHQSAKNIIEKGILLGEGAARQDFSDGSGFYLGNDLEEAVKWARHRYDDGEAVLIYQVDKKELRGDNNEKGLDLRNDEDEDEDEDEWERVVTEYRLTGYGRRQKKPSQAYRNKLKKNHFIEGPMASVSRTNPTPQEKVGTYQLCVRKEACAKLFDRSLSYVIFFER